MRDPLGGQSGHKQALQLEVNPHILPGNSVSLFQKETTLPVRLAEKACAGLLPLPMSTLSLEVRVTPPCHPLPMATHGSSFSSFYCPCIVVSTAAIMRTACTRKQG